MPDRAPLETPTANGEKRKKKPPKNEQQTSLPNLEPTDPPLLSSVTIHIPSPTRPTLLHNRRHPIRHVIPELVFIPVIRGERGWRVVLLWGAAMRRAIHGARRRRRAGGAPWHRRQRRPCRVVRVKRLDEQAQTVGGLSRAAGLWLRLLRRLSVRGGHAL